MAAEDPYRHPGGRTCAGTAGFWALMSVVAFTLVRRGPRHPLAGGRRT